MALKLFKIFHRIEKPSNAYRNENDWELLKLHFSIVRFLHDCLYYTSVQQKILLFPPNDFFDFSILFLIFVTIFFLSTKSNSKVPCKRLWKGLNIRIEDYGGMKVTDVVKTVEGNLKKLGKILSQVKKLHNCIIFSQFSSTFFYPIRYLKTPEMILTKSKHSCFTHNDQQTRIFKTS